MKFTISALRKFLDTSASLEQISQCLTNIGFEVESIIDQGKILDQFSVAKIVDCLNHPNSSKLKICSVEVEGNSMPLQIVCGASNARSGIKVAYAKIDSVIPASQLKIKKAKIAGIESNGMLCSFEELEIEGECPGIIEIPEQFAIGTKISEVFNKNDAVIEIYVTPNRPDCLGVYGIARELSAIGLGVLKNFPIPKIESNFHSDLIVENNQANACDYAVFYHLKNIKNCQSPQWLKDQLIAIGYKPISAIVDILNLVMHQTSQPLHAYDANKSGSKITIDFADQGSSFTSLQNQNYVLDNKILVIKNPQQNLAVAGIIGGLESSCSFETTDLIIESAHFNAEHITFAGRKLNILSEARHRFERNCDASNCDLAINYALQLILEICQTTATKISQKIVSGELPKIRTIDFKFDKFEKLIGIKIDQQKALNILEKLGFKQLDNFNFAIPSYRNDINLNEDLIEEIIRIYGYNYIEKQQLSSSIDNSSVIDTNQQNKLINKITTNNNYFQIEYNNSSYLSFNCQKISHSLINRGFNETINWSFVDHKISKLFAKINPQLFLQNPVSSEMDYLRPTLAIGLVNSYQKNSLRNFNNLSLFEVGNIFKDINHQQLSIAGLRAGKNLENNHYQTPRDFDVFDIKSDLLNCLENLNLKINNLDFVQNNLPQYYHPHRSASIALGKNILGYFGELHPLINQKFSIKNRLNLFEIFVTNQLTNKKSTNYKTFIANDFPVVERDFAFIVDKDLAVNELIKTISNVEKNLIQQINIFDIYAGKNIESNKKSVALNVKIQAQDRTLTSDEIENLSQNIILKVESSLNAKLRNI